MEKMHHPHGHESAPTSSARPGGLTVSADGYTLEAMPTVLEPGCETPWRFWIRDAWGAAYSKFEQHHEALLHLIVVRRDLTHYQHLHPKLTPDGTWFLPLTLPKAGFYRAFADFTIAGHAHTLGIDLAAPGHLQFAPAPDPSAAARAGEYDVQLEGGPWVSGRAAALSFVVRHQGQEVRDLQPYLGALGHLVALREGDLAYLHVHPVAAGGGGPKIDFHVAFPSAGRYRLFLEFAHAGEVHAADFVLKISPPNTPAGDLDKEK